MPNTPRQSRKDITGETDARRKRPGVSEAPDIVQETSEESFPASDPPAWTPVTAVGPPAHSGSTAHPSVRSHTEGLTEQARVEHDALLDAMHGLEAVLASPAPGREKEWTRRDRGDRHRDS